ncbi:MAG TPA: hypothetical protein VK390_06465 [Propionibacteriaceae bacterium]|nr:hypothetical protein [Propionibacteriaceae bacterium]
MPFNRVLDLSLEESEGAARVAGYVWLSRRLSRREDCVDLSTVSSGEATELVMSASAISSHLRIGEPGSQLVEASLSEDLPDASRVVLGIVVQVAHHDGALYAVVR